MKQITVVSLGPGDPKLLTLQTLDILHKSRHLILRTSRHRTADWLQEEGVIFGGRLGEYKYYDMDKVIASSLKLCKETL